MKDNDSMNKLEIVFPTCKDNNNMRQLGDTMLVTLDYLMKLANERFDIEENEQKNTMRSSSFSESSFSACSSPLTPRSVLPEYMKSASRNSSASPLLWSLRVQAVGKLNPVDGKRLSFHTSPKPIEKIDEEPITEMEVDNDNADKTAKDTPSEDLVSEMETNEDDHHKTTVKPDQDQAMEEVELPQSPKKIQPESPKPTETPLLQLQETLPVSSPSPPPPPPPPPAMIMPKKVITLPPTAPPSPPPPQPMMQLNVEVPPPSAPTPTTPPPSPSAQTPTTPPPSPEAPPPPSPTTTTAASPPPPPPMQGGSAPTTPPPVPCGNGSGTPPPPPPGGSGRTLRAKGTTKLKRSSYFIQIEEDVQKYTKQIIELQSKITNFKTNNMTELSKFHRDVESILENLTDESQVLSRFEGFPTKKLEAIRMAAALYNKLNSILTELQTWKVVAPIVQLLEKVERYFNKIKTELDTLERTKDDEAKKFKAHNIEFDFSILIKVKEAIVDEKREEGKSDAKMLWRAFQLAFRVYTFAGGHDDRADKLTRELAKEIESGPGPNHP
ncbi:hypothetical protein TSUD_64800 [Trifolium subterraneum]|uniref:Hydroxyproline-rich glycoprotein family protein n=1 Tax=Trifolium subterraneum TaxID=3900 RepID=A0A2Z6NWM1_TRISU|nr:hypothetical protein TSUD_64800 [Trifolium subterraneum]